MTSRTSRLPALSPSAAFSWGCLVVVGSAVLLAIWWWLRGWATLPFTLVAGRLTSRSSGRDQPQRPASPGNGCGAPLNSGSVRRHESRCSLSSRWTKGTGSDRGFWLARISPRLPEQPIFYAVLNEEYATQIARNWNVRESGSGFDHGEVLFARRSFSSAILFRLSAVQRTKSCGCRRKNLRSSIGISLARLSWLLPSRSIGAMTL